VKLFGQLELKMRQIDSLHEPVQYNQTSISLHSHIQTGDKSPLGLCFAPLCY